MHTVLQRALLYMPQSAFAYSASLPHRPSDTAPDASMRLRARAWAWAWACAALLCGAGLYGGSVFAQDTNHTAKASRQDARLQFYQTLVGEIAARAGDSTAAYRFLIEAAKTSADPRLYERAVDIAVTAGSGPLAWQAAGMWAAALPDSLDAQRAILRLSLALGREQDIANSLTRILNLSAAPDRVELIRAIPLTLQRLPANSQVDTVRVLQQALKSFVTQTDTASAAYAAIGFMQLSSGRTAAALDSARQAQRVNTEEADGARLALALMDQGVTQAEPIVLAHLNTKTHNTRVRFEYAKVLYSDHRTREAQRQAQQVVREDTNYVPAWLLLGQLWLDQNDTVQAQQAAMQALAIGKAYSEQAADSQRPPQDAQDAQDLQNAQDAQDTPDASNRPVSPSAQAAITQALFLLSDVAQAKGNWTEAEEWLGQVNHAQDAQTVLYKRAVLLGKQGFIDRGYALLEGMPQTNATQLRIKQATQVQWLRQFDQMYRAYMLLADMNQRFPNDPDLLYEQAMLADKLGQPEDMERLLRRVMDIKPDHHHAYNALGYALADRGERLPEALTLIEKALTFAPYDPYITDSLGWVYFRMGQLDKAERVLRKAYNIKADGEIAGHLGEVLWQSNQRDAAISLWREALSRQPDNDTLRATMQRFGVEP
jgi:tetratricopeptide (TPR) repeat protein